MFPNHYNLHLDIYKIFHFDNNKVTEDEIKKRYRKLSIKFHPDKIKNQRAVTKEDELRWADIQDAISILSNENKKIIYDNRRTRGKCKDCGGGFCGPCADALFQCPECAGVRPGSFDILPTWQTMPGVVFSKSSLRYFCRAECAKAFNTRLGYTKDVHGYTFSDSTGSPPPPVNPEKVCPGCGQEKKFPDGTKDFHLYKRINWVSLEENSEKCCSDYCLDTLLRKQNKKFTVCSRCNKVLKWNDNPNNWKKKKGTNNYFCSLTHMNEYYEETEGGLGSGGTDPLKTDKDGAIAAINNSLTQNPTINNNELEIANQNWHHEIKNANDLSTITAIKNRVLADIQNKRNAKNGGSDPLLNLKNAAIAEIDREMLKGPEIQLSELEATNQNYGADILAATSEDQIKQIKDKVIANIRTKRQTKTGGGNQDQLLQKSRADAINLINSKLAENAPIETSELNNPNWENEIIEASDTDAVNRIRDEVLADIRNKRADKAEEIEIINLLQQAKAATKYEELEIILKKIKLLFSSNAYKKYQQEIKNQEEKLQRINPQKYKETVRKSIADQLTQNGLRLEEDFDQKTQEEIEEAINSGDQQKIDQVEEKIAVKGAEKKLDDILILAKKATTLEEKQKVINELLRFIVDSANDYQQKAYQSRKSTVDSMLAKLRGKEQTETPSKPLPPLIITLLAISLLGLIITALLIIRRKRQQRVIKSIR